MFRLAGRVGHELTRTGSSLATAESCTAGWIAKALTDVPGSSGWFGSGFVTYSNEAKTRMLAVSRQVLARHGAVSEQCVRAMAAGALEVSGARLAVSVSGIAGPGGAVPGKPVGTVWFCVAAKRGRRIDFVPALKHFRGNRETVRRKSVAQALSMVLRVL